VKVLLTGGSGFLGSALALHWLKAGLDVALLLRPESLTNRLQGFENLFSIGRDTTNRGIYAFVKETNPDVVVHTACSYGRDDESILNLLDTNVSLGLAILESLATLQRPVCFINTGSALPAKVSRYALSKRQFSEWGRCLAAQSAGSLKFINVLLQQMYGPGDDRSKFPMYVLHACHRNIPELRLTAGEQARDFVYIDDVVTAYDTLLKNYNNFDNILDIEVGSGVAPTVKQFVETAHSLTESRTILYYGTVPYRRNEVMLSVADITYMAQLGWMPAFDIYLGLKRTIELEFKE
jgi:CDP-paratose synthetase